MALAQYNTIEYNTLTYDIQDIIWTLVEPSDAIFTEVVLNPAPIWTHPILAAEEFTEV